MDVHVPEAWREASERMVQSGGTILVLGGVDTGKTTFCAWLGNQFVAQGRTVGFVDADVGQSDLGPPGTIGLGLARQPLDRLGDLEPIALTFVGSVAPEGRLLDVVLGVQQLVQRAAREGAEVTIIDTTGFIHGAAARALKAAKIRAVAPCHLVALGKREEVGHLVVGYEHLRGLTVHRLPVSPQVRARSREQRRQAREESFRAYFEVAEVLEIDLKACRLTGTSYRSGQELPGHFLTAWRDRLAEHVYFAERTAEGPLLVVERMPSLEVQREWEGEDGPRPFLIDAGHFDGLLVGLADEQRELLALGLIQSLHFRQGWARVLTPLRDPSVVREVLFGGVRLAPDGRELGRVRPGEI